MSLVPRSSPSQGAQCARESEPADSAVLTPPVSPRVNHCFVFLMGMGEKREEGSKKKGWLFEDEYNNLGRGKANRKPQEFNTVLKNTSFSIQHHFKVKKQSRL